MRRFSELTPRLILRPLRSTDFKNWQRAWGESGEQRNPWDHPPIPLKKLTRQRFLRTIKIHRRLAAKDDYYFFGIFRKSDGALVGHLDFDIFVRGSHQFANFGYRIHGPFWKKGYGKEAAAKGLKIGFQSLKIHRLEAAINLDNRASIALAKSIGMQREGIKKRYWFENGKWTDHMIYVAIPEDFEEQGRA